MKSAAREAQKNSLFVPVFVSFEAFVFDVLFFRRVPLR